MIKKTGNPDSSWIKSVFKVFLINAVLIGLVIIIIELLFGNWFTETNSNSLNLIKNRTFYYKQELYPGDKEIIYSRDINGLRGTYNSVDDIDILTIGGSTTDQRYISEGQPWQDVLAEKFSKNGTPVSVVNAGLDGQSTYGHIKNLEYWFPLIEGLKTKYIFFYVGINDLYSRAEHGHFDDLLGNKTIIAIIRSKSILYHLVFTLYGHTLAGRFNSRHVKIDFENIRWTKKGLLNEPPYREFASTLVADYRRRLDTLMLLTQKYSTRVISVTQRTFDYTIDNGEVRGGQ